MTGAGDPATHRGPRGLRRADLAAVALLGAASLAILAFDGMLWRERMQGMALFDPALGGDPLWRARPSILPLVVAGASGGRLLLARRRWPMRWPLTVGYAVLLFVGVLSVAAALVPPPAAFPR